MKRLLWLILICGVSLSLACSKQAAKQSAASPSASIGIFSDEAIIITKDLARKMKGASGETTRQVESQLYNPKAHIELTILAKGSYGPEELLAEARKTEPEKFSICLVLTGLQNALGATNPDAARTAFLKQYETLLDYLRQRGIPVVACEILPIVTAYQKPSYQLPAAQIAELIQQMNRDLYGLAMQKADGFVFTHKLFAGRVGTDKDSLLLNSANAEAENGIQPTVEGMRLLGQLLARALHQAGYRDGRILVLGDSTIANEALTRTIDRLGFLLPKYLEIELDKTCP